MGGNIFLGPLIRRRHLVLLAELEELSALPRVNRNLLTRISSKKEIYGKREVSASRSWGGERTKVRGLALPFYLLSDSLLCGLSGEGGSSQHLGRLDGQGDQSI